MSDINSRAINSGRSECGFAIFALGALAAFSLLLAGLWAFVEPGAPVYNLDATEAPVSFPEKPVQTGVQREADDQPLRQVEEESWGPLKSTPGAPSGGDDMEVSNSVLEAAPTTAPMTAAPRADTESVAVKQQSQDTTEMDGQRSLWIRQHVSELNRITAEDCQDPIEASVIDIDGLYDKRYRLIAPAGCILFEDGSWVYLISHSSHDDEEIGDITVAIDNEGRVYANEGHVCGGVINFHIRQKLSMGEAGHFFEHFTSDTDGVGWTRLDIQP